MNKILADIIAYSIPAIKILIGIVVIYFIYKWNKKRKEKSK